MSEHHQLRRLLFRASLMPLGLMAAVSGVLLVQVLTVLPLAGVEARRGILLALITTGAVAAAVLTVLAVVSRREEQRLEKELDAAVQRAARSRSGALEQLVAERTRDLLALNRELQTFSHAVSHDLREPIRAIAAAAGQLVTAHAAQLGPEGRALLERIRAEASGTDELLRALVELARVARTDVRDEEVDLSALARELETELRARHPARTIELLVQDGVRARGDPGLLRDLLRFLLENAFEATRSTPAGRVEFATLQGPGGRTHLVRDNGVGFDMAYASRLFSPFQKLHPPEEFDGKGLGLATVQRIVHRHGGRIWAEAVPGQGATFYFTLSGGNR